METEQNAQERMDRVANKNKHASTIEHLTYNFDIDGISRACLQELSRHRIASLSVKSSRYTLKELKDEDAFVNEALSQYILDDEMRQRAQKYVVFTEDDDVNASIVLCLECLRWCIAQGSSNDFAKYTLPEAYKTSLIWSINARSLQNFLELRTNKAALWEIRKLANEIYDKLPQDHKFLFSEKIYKEEK
jgi:thymidylate synthase (FAD)